MCTIQCALFTHRRRIETIQSNERTFYIWSFLFFVADYDSCARHKQQNKKLSMHQYSVLSKNENRIHHYVRYENIIYPSKKSLFLVMLTMVINMICVYMHSVLQLRTYIGPLDSQIVFIPFNVTEGTSFLWLLHIFWMKCD